LQYYNTEEERDIANSKQYKQQTFISTWNQLLVKLVCPSHGALLCPK